MRNSGHLATRNPQYAPIAESSPSPTRTGRPPQINTAGGGARRGRAAEDDGDYSPVDAGAFQAAIGFSGMSFQGETPPPLATPMSLDPSYSQHNADPYAAQRPSEDNEFFSSAVYDDTARLTDVRNLQPMAGVPHFEPSDRSSFQSVRFLTPDGSLPPHRRTDDVGNVEAATAGLRPSTIRNRSLSPAGSESPLYRAGTMMRNMSQRVVNISNEPEIAERTMRRKSTLPHARLQGPPSFPAMPEYIPGAASTPVPSSPIEKPPSPAPPQNPSVQRRQQPLNPLRGRSLGLFPPDSKIRMKLCDVLVHPIIEPILLLLIVVQTILLAVDASQNVHNHDHDPPSDNGWGAPIDYALLCLFIIYTIETVIRIIVSGFIINPVEYSTINRQVGLRQAVVDHAQRFFGPQRQASVKRVDPSVEPQMPIVLRSFTAAQNIQALGPGDSRAQQRARLAHRAYLRHSFNRTDFVAVVSFWIAFAIGISGLQNKKHILIFKMLSCLRIIRLLNLTSGTSVSESSFYPMLD
jgi:hypothetical protein